MTRIEKRFLVSLGDQWKEATPGISAQAFLKGRKVLDVRVGRTWAYYDLASLTKPLFTVTSLMRLVEEKRLHLRQPVQSLLPWFRSRTTPLQSLLTHSAGMIWWLPFYKKIPLNRPLPLRWEAILQQLEPLKPARRKSSVYSDIDFLLLGEILRVATGMELDEIWEELAGDLGLHETHFHRENKPVHRRSLYAPTEDCQWRKLKLQGEVHDPNTWALGGVAPHAGLFGPHDELSKWALGFRKAYFGETTRWVAQPETVRRFARRSVPVQTGDWALGLMMPTKGRASCGRYFHASSVGHTGFTGTSWWFDPKRDLVVTILSNRVHPTAENKAFVTLRPRLHDWIVEAIVG